jgi:hypothetical protein
MHARASATAMGWDVMKTPRLAPALIEGKCSDGIAQDRRPGKSIDRATERTQPLHRKEGDPDLLRRIAAFVSGLLFAAGALLRAEAAQADITFVRDAETEAVIADYAAPLFAAGGLDPKAVRVYLIDDDSINAFVAGGMNLFI